MAIDHFPEHTKTCAKIAICIVTCFRPDVLQSLLDGIRKQTFTKNNAPRLLLIPIPILLLTQSVRLKFAAEKIEIR